jgi:predicted transglutaminase-like cysteine proteinase
MKGACARLAALAAAAAAASASASPTHSNGAPTSTSPGFITYDSLAGAPYSLTYDNRSFFINGQRTVFLSGVMHYPRSTPAMWDDLFTKARNDGLNMIRTFLDTSVAGAHEPWQLPFGMLTLQSPFLVRCPCRDVRLLERA